MPTAFELKKAKILEQLAIPDQDYSDLSPKGSVDEGIRDLVRDINELDGFVTTSSCAGRAALYLEGLSKRKNVEVDAGEREALPGGIASGGKGGGQWLYASHDPISLPKEQEGNILAMLGLSELATSNAAKDVTDVRFIHLKFEPLILHILHASLPLAQQTLSAALSAGFRESGISSITSDNQVLVAVRTTGLAFDSIVGYTDSSEQTHLMVPETYLRTLLRVANERFVVNSERKDRFWRGLLEQVKGKGEVRQGWEPAEERRDRKRAEGLRRKADLEAQKRQAQAGEAEGGDSAEVEMITIMEN